MNIVNSREKFFIWNHLSPGKWEHEHYLVALMQHMVPIRFGVVDGVQQGKAEGIRQVQGDE